MPTATHEPGSVDAFVNGFERFAEDRQGEPRWLQRARRAAISRFAALGFPTTRDEEWRFTSVAPIARTVFVPSADGVHRLTDRDIELFAVSSLSGPRLVFVNGRFVAHLSRLWNVPAGVRVSGLADTLRGAPEVLDAHLTRHARDDAQAFTALNTALFEDGAYIEVSPGCVVQEPIEILFLATTAGGPTVSHPRVLVVAGEHSQVAVVEGYAGRAGERYFTNAVSEIVAGEGAVVSHYRAQRESRSAFHVSATHARLARGGRLASFSATFGGALTRNDVTAVLAAEGCDCTLDGLYVAGGTSLVDNHTIIDHAEPHGTSHEVYKGIVDGRARGVFNGKIVVRPDAQKTDAKQTNKTLLLSDEAQIDTKPQLEIFANDVKCTHGATVGQLNADALFYLRARGIGEAEARAMLVRAFASDVVNRVGSEPVREQLEAWLGEELDAMARIAREAA